MKSLWGFDFVDFHKHLQKNLPDCESIRNRVFQTQKSNKSKMKKGADFPENLWENPLQKGFAEVQIRSERRIWEEASFCLHKKVVFEKARKTEVSLRILLKKREKPRKTSVFRMASILDTRHVFRGRKGYPSP